MLGRGSPRGFLGQPFLEGGSPGTTLSRGGSPGTRIVQRGGPRAPSPRAAHLVTRGRTTRFVTLHFSFLLSWTYASLLAVSTIVFCCFHDCFDAGDSCLESIVYCVEPRTHALGVSLKWRPPLNPCLFSNLFVCVHVFLHFPPVVPHPWRRIPKKKPCP